MILFAKVDFTKKYKRGLNLLLVLLTLTPAFLQTVFQCVVVSFCAKLKDNNEIRRKTVKAFIVSLDACRMLT